MKKKPKKKNARTIPEIERAASHMLVRDSAGKVIARLAMFAYGTKGPVQVPRTMRRSSQGHSQAVIITPQNEGSDRYVTDRHTRDTLSTRWR